MSRHLYHCEWNEQPLQVVVGYDRKHKSFFLQLAWVDEKTGDALAYVSDGALKYDPNDLRTIRSLLARLQIPTPDSLWWEVAYDAQKRLGNRVVRHLSDGRVINLES